MCALANSNLITTDFGWDPMNRTPYHGGRNAVRRQREQTNLTGKLHLSRALGDRKRRTSTGMTGKKGGAGL